MFDSPGALSQVGLQCRILDMRVDCVIATRDKLATARNVVEKETSWCADSPTFERRAGCRVWSRLSNVSLV